MIRLAHIVHPVVVPPESDLTVAQPITFESMRIARDLAASRVEADLQAVQYADEPRMPLPEGFRRTPDLERSVADRWPFARRRKLALIRDLLDRLYQAAPQADFLIYTNADIALQPYFYLAVARLIETGHDALVINRRTIPAGLGQTAGLPHMWAQVGEPHIGHDCFVFRRDLYPRFVLDEVCVGVRLIGRVLLWNLLAHSRSFREFKELQLTFHLGSDRPWKRPEFADYDDHNHRCARRALQALDRAGGLLGRLQREHPEYLIAVDWGSLSDGEGETSP